MLRLLNYQRCCGILRIAHFSFKKQILIERTENAKPIHEFVLQIHCAFKYSLKIPNGAGTTSRSLDFPFNFNHNSELGPLPAKADKCVVLSSSENKNKRPTPII